MKTKRSWRAEGTQLWTDDYLDNNRSWSSIVAVFTTVTLCQYVAAEMNRSEKAKEGA